MEMQCDCARSLIEALTGSAADVPPAPPAAPALVGRCLWCGEPTEMPAAASLGSDR
jgi:hypothetical protein